MTGERCIVDPETFAYMAPSGQLHAHTFDPTSGLSVCCLDNTCEACGEPTDACECMGPRICPRCGCADLREVTVLDMFTPGKPPVEHVDLACIDCTWRQRLGGD